MDVLILGLSSIAQRRVVPALRSLPSVGRIDVATRKAANGAVDWSHGDVYPDYRLALDKSSAELVYVSLINSEHEPWATQAIRAGRHAVVDKPSFLGVRPAEAMLDLAAHRGVCLAEATVYAYHPQVQLVRSLFAEADCVPTRLSAEFCFPDLEPTNFRYRQAFGGGALWDVGPYAVSLGRVFFGEEPTEVACQVSSSDGPDLVDAAFATVATYSGGRSLSGLFGFGSVYRNRVDVLGESIGVEVDRIFTTPPDLANELRVTRTSGASVVEAPSGDAFAEFFGHVCCSIEQRDWSGLTADLLADARTLQRLRDAAGAR